MPVRSKSSASAKSSTSSKSTSPKRKSRQTDKTSPASNGRKILYPKPELRLCQGKDSLKDEPAKLLLGWQEEPEGESFGDDYLFKDNYGKKIRCCNNIRNRPLIWAAVNKLVSEILRGNWNLNLENIIIGRTGLVLSGQHRLIALVLACQIWEQNKSSYEDHWKTRPTIDTSIGYGCAEDQTTINTLDTGTPRSLSDALYTSDIFKDHKAAERKQLTKLMEFAVRYVWDHTGVQDAHGIYKTHAEFSNFIERHPTILKCVEHIFEENGKERKLAKFVTPGTAAGLMYLMGCSKTDPVKYVQVGDESGHDWSLIDQAETFWTLLASGDESLKAVGQRLAKMLDPDPETGDVNQPTKQEKLAVIVRAWERYSAEQSITLGDLALSYDRSGDYPVLTDTTSVGGLDIKYDDDAIDPAVTLEEVESEKARIQNEKRTGQPKAGDEAVWVRDKDGNHWQGKVVSVKQDVTQVIPAEGYAGHKAGKPFSVNTVDVSYSKPEGGKS